MYPRTLLEIAEEENHKAHDKVGGKTKVTTYAVVKQRLHTTSAGLNLRPAKIEAPFLLELLKYLETHNSIFVIIAAVNESI